ncbi:hypothetical protein MRX96_034622 [Rhipicephalus microplus]
MAKTLLALTKAPAADHAWLKATKTPLKKTTRPRPDQKAQPDTSALDQAEMECQESVAGDGITHQDNEGADGRSAGEERDDDGSWQTVLTVHQKKALAKARKKLTTTEGDYDFMSPTSKSLSQPTSQRRPQKRKLPPLSKEDFKIILGNQVDTAERKRHKARSLEKRKKHHELGAPKSQPTSCPKSRSSTPTRTPGVAGGSTQQQVSRAAGGGVRGNPNNITP